MLGKERIICALDVDSCTEAVKLVRSLREQVGVFKIGLELLSAEGPGIVQVLQDAGAERIFYDAKLHDIPNTVSSAMREITRLGVWCVTVHAPGGADMLRAAVNGAKAGAKKYGATPPRVLAVTLLTSIGEQSLQDELCVDLMASQYVARMAIMAREAGCDGVIASPLEIEVVRAAVPDNDFLIITPGVRQVNSDKGDQTRVMTPSEAIGLGANYLVIGRPITRAANPLLAAKSIGKEMEESLDR